MIAHHFGRSFPQLHLVSGPEAKRRVWRVPESRWMDGADGIIEVLNEIERASEADHEASTDLVAEYRRMSAAGEFGPSFYWKRFRALCRREAWRIGSYVIWLTNLHQVLVAQHGFLSELAAKGAGASVLRAPELLPEIKTLRDKVYAHPAYAMPRAGDDGLAIATSLALLAGDDGSWHQGVPWKDSPPRVAFTTATNPEGEPSAVSWIRSRAKGKGSEPLFDAMRMGPLTLLTIAEIADDLVDWWLAVLVRAAETVSAMSDEQVGNGLRTVAGLSVELTEITRLPARASRSGAASTGDEDGDDDEPSDG